MPLIHTGKVRLQINSQLYSNQIIVHISGSHYRSRVSNISDHKIMALEEKNCKNYNSLWITKDKTIDQACGLADLVSTQKETSFF